MRKQNLYDVVICGIPATVDVHNAHYTEPDHSTWSSADDYYGGWELDYTICDRNGRQADWLDRKLNGDYTSVERQLLEQL